MEYAIHALARLAGVSTRTLRYYDQIGLLRPLRTAANGVRVYGPHEVDRLQQILFYRQLGVALEEIGRILDAPGYDRAQALRSHLDSLLEQQKELEALIGNVSKTLRTLKGETSMEDKEKFAGLKQKLVQDNEAQYGAEVRARWGDDAADAANARLLDMDRATWERAQALRAQCEALLQAALAKGDPAGAEAQQACDVHRQWLCLFWKPGTYSKAAHAGLGEMYAADGRFAAYYERLGKGCAAFFRDALRIYCADGQA